MGLIEQLLQQQASRVESLERRIENLEKRLILQDVPKPAPVMPPRDVPAEILKAIHKHWDKMREPIPQRHLSQIFTKASQSYGGIRQVMDSLEETKRIARVRTPSGASLVFPFEVFTTLSLDAIDKLVFAGLSSVQAKRLRARQALYVNSVQDQPSSDQIDAANAEALRAFKGE